MSASSPSSGSKPSPKYLSTREAMQQYRITCDALRHLCAAMLEIERLPPETRASLLSLAAVLKGPDGP